jgi:hypothetical protein
MLCHKETTTHGKQLSMIYDVIVADYPSKCLFSAHMEIKNVKTS